MKKRILAPLGLDAKTEAVYRVLLSLGDATAFRTAKAAGIKRTSVYHILDNLISMGIVGMYTSRGVKRYVAENPQRLKAYFEQKAILAERILPLLQAEIQERQGFLNVSSFHGREAMKVITEEALETKEKLIRSIGSPKRLLDFVGGKYAYGKRRRDKGIMGRSIRFLGDDPSTIPRLNQVKFMKQEIHFPGYIVIFDANVGIMLFEGTGYGFVVRSKAFSDMMKFLFEELWKVL